MTRKSTNPNKIYEQISISAAQKNTFDKVHPVTFTGKIGNLIPILCMPVSPGDTVNLSFDMLVRFPALVVPTMARFDAYIHSFYVPNRVVNPLFDEWFEDPESTAVPYMDIDLTLSAAEELFLDYFGIPPISASAGGNTITVRPEPFAAYQKIYNDYYRPRPFENPVPFEVIPGDNTAANRADFLTMRQRSWEHDYHTSMLPEPLIAPDTALGIGEITLKENWETIGGSNPIWLVDSLTNPGGTSATLNASGTTDTGPGTIPPNQLMAYDPDGSLEMTGGITVNAYREALARQRYLEKMGRAGGEYYEIIQAIYGKKISDGRLQRAEYITGMQAPVIINPVLSTSVAAGEPTPGEQYGHAFSIGEGGGGSFECEEHGYVIAIFSLIPKPMYKQGISRHFRSFNREDFIIPDLAHIGEQAVESWEIVAYEEPAAAPYTEIGYLPNYTHYKQMQGRIAGEFRTSLDSWVVVKEYAALPTLDKDFVQVPEDIADHIFVTASGVTHPLWVNVLNQVYHTQPLPVFSDPI